MSKTTLVIEISKHRLRVCSVQVSRRQNIVNAREVFDFASEVNAQDIESVLARFKYDELIVALPRSFFLIRFLDLPSFGGRELAAMLPFQLAKLSPLAPEEMLYSFSVLEQKQDCSKVIAFLMPKKKIGFLIEFLKGHKTLPHAFVLADEGLANWALYQDKAASGDELLAVDIDKDYVDLIVLREGKIVFSRACAYASRDEAAAAISQSLDIYRKQFSSSGPARGIFTGIYLEGIEAELNLDSAKFIRDLDGFSSRGGLSLNEDNQSFASLLGLGLRGSKFTFDFSPSFIKEKRNIKARNRRYRQFAYIFMQIIFIVGILFARDALIKYRYLDFLNARLEGVGPMSKSLSGLSDKLQIIDKYIEGKVKFSRYIYDLFSVLKQGVKVSRIEFDENNKFSIKGRAPDASFVFDMASALNRSDLFESSKVHYAASINREGVNMVEFYISGEYK